MKKKSLLGMGIVAALPLLSSCTGEDKFQQTVPFNATTLNVITNVADGTTTVSPGRYAFSLTMTNTGQSGIINASNIQTNPDAPLSFTTEEKSYTGDTYMAYFQNVTSSSINLVNANFLLTGYYYRPSQFNIDAEFPGYGDVVLASYSIGESYKVRTFQPETFYKGNTVTSYPYMGQQQNYATDKIYYRLSLDHESNQATIYIYNAKFSDSPEPVKEQIVLEDLPVSSNGGEITVTGSNIVPLVLEGGQLTPNENYIFKDISFRTSNDLLTQCEIGFTVQASMTVGGNTISYDYLGSFSGDYIYNAPNQ